MARLKDTQLKKQIFARINEYRKACGSSFSHQIKIQLSRAGHSAKTWVKLRHRKKQHDDYYHYNHE
jgi:hypothetical protein